MTEVLNTGAIFALEDRFSAGLDKLIGGLGKAEEQAKVLQLQLDKIGLGGVVTKAQTELEKLVGATSTTTDKMLGSFGMFEKTAVGNFDAISLASNGLWSKMTEGMSTATNSVLGNVDILKSNMTGLWSGMADGADAAAASVVTAMGSIGAAVEAALRGAGDPRWARPSAGFGSKE